MKDGGTIDNDNVALGRVQRTTVCEDDEQLTLWNQHNEKLATNRTGEIADKLKRDIGAANGNPSKCSV